LLAGSQTISAVLGVANDAINQLGIPADEKTRLINQMPVAYAVTYIFGTAGSAWLLASIGPKLLRVDLAAECKKLEATLGAGEAEPGVMSMARRFDVRAYRVTNKDLIDKTVAELEARPKEVRVFIVRVRQGGAIIEAEPGTLIRADDVVAVATRQEALVARGTAIGPEVDDKELLDFPVQMLDVVVTEKVLAGKTLAQLATHEFARGVFLRKLVRADHEMPFTPGTTVDRGDVLQVVGPKRNVELAAKAIGYADRPTNMTDIRRGRHRTGRPGRGADDQSGRDPAEPQHQRRRADRRAGLRLAAIGEANLRPDSGAGAVGPEQRRPHHLHRRRRHQRRPELRGRAEAGRAEPVPRRHRGHLGPADHRFARRAGTFSSTPASASAPAPARAPPRQRWA
jgi:Trk K+ transport system NAD-binding subunit